MGADIRDVNGPAPSILVVVGGGGGGGGGGGEEESMTSFIL